MTSQLGTKNRGFLAVLLASTLTLATACNQSSLSAGAADANLSTGDSDGATVTTVGAQTTTVTDDYTASTFSSNVLFHKTENKILLDYNFFPSGSDFDSQAKTVTFCSDDVSLSDDVQASLSAPPSGENSDCASEITLNASDATFTVNGLVYSFTGTLTVFAEDFGFNITRDGFVDSSDGATISVSSTSAGLSDVTDELLTNTAGE